MAKLADYSLWTRRIQLPECSGIPPLLCSAPLLRIWCLWCAQIQNSGRGVKGSRDPSLTFGAHPDCVVGKKFLKNAQIVERFVAASTWTIAHYNYWKCANMRGACGILLNTVRLYDGDKLAVNTLLRGVIPFHKHAKLGQITSIQKPWILKAYYFAESPGGIAGGHASFHTHHPSIPRFMPMRICVAPIWLRFCGSLRVIWRGWAEEIALLLVSSPSSPD